VVCGALLGLIWMQLNQRINSLEDKVKLCDEDRKKLHEKADEMQKTAFTQLKDMFGEMMEFMRQTINNQS